MDVDVDLKNPEIMKTV